MLEWCGLRSLAPEPGGAVGRGAMWLWGHSARDRGHQLGFGHLGNKTRAHLLPGHRG
jgi:hypothetical protein